jgi:RNA polymerase sigma-70 factor, ECF subfamily
LAALTLVRTEAATAPPQSDAQLLALVGQQNEPAFQTLVERHYDVVYRVVWRICSGKLDAEDIVQETFLKLWRGVGQIKEAAALRGWLIRVASNAMLDKLRARTHDDLEFADEVADTRPNAETDLQRAQVSNRIAQSLANLPERQRLALTLVYYEQMTNIAAAAIMEISVDAIESLLSRARRSLKENLSSQKNELLAVLTSEGQSL